MRTKKAVFPSTESDLRIHRFRHDLRAYINGNLGARSGRALSIVSMRRWQRRKAKILQRSFLLQPAAEGMTEKNTVVLDLKPYEGKNPQVQRMMSHVATYLKEDLVGAYVHGSLATFEDIAYSDFDALAIIADETLGNSKRLAAAAYFLFKAQSILIDLDPLQHHGWFVLSESDLKRYPEDYLPAESLRSAKSLLKDQGLTLTLRIPEARPDLTSVFERHCLGLIQLVRKKRFPRNVYQLKALLSQVMLLPALYVQARDKKGIFKKDSFASAKMDFSASDWSVMDEISKLREQWAYRISPWRRCLLTRTPIQISRSLAYRFAPAIPSPMRDKLTIDFFARIRRLMARMEEKLRPA